MNALSPTSSRAREHLRQSAVAEFRERGFWRTTMDHVRLAADVSRGGLYYQYANTEEILLDALEHERSGDDVNDLEGFLAEQATALHDIDATLRPIVYEYVLGLPADHRRALLVEQFRQAEGVVVGMLGDVSDADDRAFLARHIVRRLEGLSIAAMAGALDDEDLERELADLRGLTAG
ncbi:TetR/AcrR family transcriptional regulator [Plantibacter sp. ME-Dv--P-122b]|uniref:TetR/AcrR family transcriptional regulator n=1 Tax=Plantibacter sp. ME-Dv--P-122b TaxID=3040300 RepID=UPI00254B77C2|nr:TetR/AcrR family transcriptional regulator [Plantibacter sp. ME-Dv--P-122b]